jgi:hypothetical protein
MSEHRKDHIAELYKIGQAQIEGISRDVNEKKNIKKQ